MIQILLVLFVIVIISAVVLLVFESNLRSRLSFRIAALILAAGPTALISLIILNSLITGTVHGPAPWWDRLMIILALIIGGPLILGLLATRFVTKPMSQFDKAISSLKQNNYQVELKPTGIREFDKVFMEFNDLILRLSKEEELRKDLISDTSHELNTPLAAMVSQLTAMQEGVLPITKGRVKALTAQTTRLTDLVSQLNEYTRARAGAGEAKQTINLLPLILELQSAFETALNKAGMKLVVEVPSSYKLHANQQSLNRILTNIIQNSIRYSEGKTLWISANKERLEVRDDGQGVPKESLANLFERFYRVDKSRSRETGGLGLGLAIVRELVHAQGWQIHAEDNKPGLKIVIEL